MENDGGGGEIFKTILFKVKNFNCPLSAIIIKFICIRVFVSNPY